MFYQNNNDYMRDAFLYSQPQNSTYQYNGMNNYYSPVGNMQNSGMNMMNPYSNNMNYCQNSLEGMYPQIYRVIDPVAKRVILNNGCQYYSEDNLNNMVDTVFNIVEGDVSSLTNSSNNMMNSDDTVTQGPNRNATTNTSKPNNESVRPTSTVNTPNNCNNILKDLIKIIIIKELLSRQCNCNNMNYSNPNFNNYYPQRYMI